MTDLLNAAAADLAEKGYSLIKTERYENLISEETAELCFYRPSGAVFNVVVIINSRREKNFEDRFSELLRRIKKSFNVNSANLRLVCLGLVVGGEEAGGFVLKEDFEPSGEVVKIRWAYNEETGELLCERNAPDRFDGIEEVLKDFTKKEVAEQKTVSSLMRRSAAKSQKFIKNKRVVITYAMIALNIIIFLAMSLCGGSENTETLLKFGAIYAPFIKQGEVYRLFSYMFLHIGAAHLFSNMLSLYIFGTRCERYYGYVRYAAVYVISGLGCSLMSMTLSGNMVSAGASGAIMGLMASALAYTSINKIKMDGLDAYVYVIFSVINLGFGFIYADVDNFGHIGGFLTGFVLGIILGYTDKKKVMENERDLQY